MEENEKQQKERDVLRAAGSENDLGGAAALRIGGGGDIFASFRDYHRWNLNSAAEIIDPLFTTTRQ